MVSSDIRSRMIIAISDVAIGDRNEQDWVFGMYI
jgi:hypothetical protein